MRNTFTDFPGQSLCLPSLVLLPLQHLSLAVSCNSSISSSRAAAAVVVKEIADKKSSYEIRIIIQNTCIYIYIYIYIYMRVCISKPASSLALLLGNGWRLLLLLPRPLQLAISNFHYREKACKKMKLVSGIRHDNKNIKI